MCLSVGESEFAYEETQSRHNGGSNSNRVDNHQAPKQNLGKEKHGHQPSPATMTLMMVADSKGMPAFGQGPTLSTRERSPFPLHIVVVVGVWFVGISGDHCLLMADPPATLSRERHRWQRGYAGSRPLLRGPMRAHARLSEAAR